MEEPLFTIRNKNTREEFIRFNRVILNKEHHYIRSMIIVNVVVVLIGVCLLLTEKNAMFPTVIFVVVFLICYNWKLSRGVDKRAAKTFEHNKIGKDLEFQISFFCDYYKISAETGFSDIEYSKLYKIIETTTNLYFMYSKNQGVIIRKSECSSELIEFLHSIKFKYNL